MIVGCYTMHLYCDGPRKHDYGTMPLELVGETEGACFARARKHGWRIDKHVHKAYCPACRKEVPRNLSS